MPRDKLPTLTLIRVAAIVARHEPSREELMQLSGLSRAQVARYLTALRSVGCVITANRRGRASFWRMDCAGVFDFDQLRQWRDKDKQEAALQALADESQRLGMYEIQEAPHHK